MQRKPLNHVQYLAELNQRLWADPEFAEGMAFHIYPDGKIAGHLRDASDVGSCRIPAVFSRIEQAVACEYELVVPVAAPRIAEGMLA
ncbi:hypothetical protein [Pseudorhodoferax sp. Leaf274]|uniref:hypothetical protein n=1 Tax=Pseudorhodoferax sp. Leaf274 TaxID=1736318 RepID=UPI0007028DCC|nr:hypothetical protein [Pseudorhodoferax sp. Leaf274]KQP37126.1 hypothetical protein ASF44_15600 [Pseudorhodoferax sp. Leaf274]